VFFVFSDTDSATEVVSCWMCHHMACWRRIRSRCAACHLSWTQLSKLEDKTIIITMQNLRKESVLFTLWRHVDGAAVQLHSFLASACVELSGQLHGLATLPYPWRQFNRMLGGAGRFAEGKIIGLCL